MPTIAIAAAHPCIECGTEMVSLLEPWHPETVGDARDTALVLSGGSINGALLEAGFLRRLHESELWPRVGWIFGTSAGALAGTMGALERLDDLEEFLLGLQATDVFRPNKLWRLPLVGSHEYALPATVAERLEDTAELAEQLTRAEIELVVCATDLTAREEGCPDPHAFELVYSSRTTGPDELAEAILGIGGDQRDRAADPGRRPDRDRRRLDAELPARARVRASRRAAHRRLPLRHHVAAGRDRADRAPAPPPRAVRPHPADPRARRGAARGGGAPRAW